jgi:hypothetical protein
VFAWFIFTDSFLTFFLPVVLDLAVVAIIPIAIGVVSGSGSIYAAAVFPRCVVLDVFQFWKAPKSSSSYLSDSFSSLTAVIAFKDLEPLSLFGPWLQSDTCHPG